MDNSMQRGGRMLGNSKIYGSDRPPQNAWRFGDSRMLDSSRPFKDPPVQGSSRQHGDFRMQDSRMEPSYSPPRMSNVSDMPGNARISNRVRGGGGQLQREVRAHPESRTHSGNRSQGNSRMYEDLPVYDQLRARSSAVAYDYNHQRFDDCGPMKDNSGPSNFMMNSNENVRSGRSGYNIQDNIRPGSYDALPGIPSDSSVKKNIGILPPKSYGALTGLPPGSGHILTPSLTSSSGPQPVEGMRPTGNRGSYPKGKSSKAFDYLKNWRLKMNMPTDAFLLEKEGVGNQQDPDVIAPQTHDDWYTQPPTAEPRVGRASIDPEWTNSGNSFSDKDAYGDRSGNKYGEMRYGMFNEPPAAYPRDQIRESDKTGNPPWKWDEEATGSQNQSGKRSYESMASGPRFNSANRESHYVQGEMVESKRSRWSPSRIQNDRAAVEQYASMIAQESLPQNNGPYSDTSKFRMNSNDTFYEPHNDWKNSSFHRRPPVDSSKFGQSRSPHDSRSENAKSRHDVFPGEIKEMMTREGPQASYSQPREVRNLPHNVPHSQRSPEPLGRERYAEPHLQNRASRLTEHGRSPELNQTSMNQGRLLINEMFVASVPFSQDMSPRLYPRSRSQRSPMKAKSPGPGMRGRSPPFSHDKSPPMPPRARNRSSPWRKGKSPGLERGRPLGSERERSPRLVGKGRSSGAAGKQRSPGRQRLVGPPRRATSPEVARRVKSPGPLGRMRSTGSPRRGRSPGPQGRERSSGPPGRGRSLDHGRWKSPGRPLEHSGRGNSPELYERNRPLESAGRGKSAMFQGKGRSPIHSGAPRGPSSLPLERGRPPGKSQSGRRVSQGSIEQGKLLAESSGRGASPGPGRGKPSGTSGRVRLSGTAARDRSSGVQGRGRQTGASDRGRAPNPSIAGQPSKSIKDRSPGLVPHHSAGYQEQPRVRRRSDKGQTNSPNLSPRGRSPLKGNSLGGARIRSASFSQGKGRSMMKEESERLDTRSARPSVKRLPPGPREKNENLIGHEFGDYKEKMESSPYHEEISMSPRTGRVWSPTRRSVMTVRSRPSRERSRSVDRLQRGCSPVSPQSGGYPGGRNLYPQESFIPEREDRIQQDRPSHFYRDCSPLSVDGYPPVRKSSVEVETKGRGGSQRERFYSPSREVSFATGRHAEKIHNSKGNWKEYNKDRGSQHYHGKKGAPGKVSDTKNVKKVIDSKFSEAPGGTLSEEDVDDEDLRIHLLRLREQKVEMKLMKLEEESKETELKLREFKKNHTAPRRESPVDEVRRFAEKETFHPHGRRQEPYPWKPQRLPSEQERYHRQQKKY